MVKVFTEGPRARHQRRNIAFLGQPGLKQGDIAPASKLEQCQEDNARPVQLLCNKCTAELDAYAITRDRGVLRTPRGDSGWCRPTKTELQ